MNTKLILRSLAASAALLTASAAWAQSTDTKAPEGNRPPRHRPHLPPELVKKYDTNGDGKLDETERAALKADIDSGKIPKPERPPGAGDRKGPGPDGPGKKGKGHRPPPPGDDQGPGHDAPPRPRHDRE